MNKGIDTSKEKHYIVKCDDTGEVVSVCRTWRGADRALAYYFKRDPRMFSYSWKLVEPARQQQ